MTYDDHFAAIPGLRLWKEIDQYSGSMRQDGTLVFTESHPDTARDIWILRPGGKPEPWLVTPALEGWPTFSPDGRLIAFASNESKRFEVYIKPFSDSTKRYTISIEGGTCPVWSPEGDRLFFRQGTYIMAVDVGRDGSPVGKPRVLFDGGWALGTAGGLPAFPTNANINGFAVMPDGEHFLMVRAEPAAIPTKLHVIFNWFEELKRRCPTSKN